MSQTTGSGPAPTPGPGSDPDSGSSGANESAALAEYRLRAGPARVLVLVAAAIAVIIFMLGFYGEVTVTSYFSGPLLMGAGFLAGTAVLPRVGRVLAPAAVLSAVGTLLLLHPPMGVRAPGVVVAALVLGFVQTAALVGALLLDAGVVHAPQGRRRAGGHRSAGFRGYPLGSGPSGYGSTSYGPSGFGAAGPGPSGYGPSGFGPPGYGAPGYDAAGHGAGQAPYGATPYGGPSGYAGSLPAGMGAAPADPYGPDGPDGPVTGEAVPPADDRTMADAPATVEHPVSSASAAGQPGAAVWTQPEAPSTGQPEAAPADDRTMQHRVVPPGPDLTKAGSPTTPHTHVDQQDSALPGRHGAAGQDRSTDADRPAESKWPPDPSDGSEPTQTFPAVGQQPPPH